MATYFKGEPFLRECHQNGCSVLLLTSDTLTGAAWPRDAITEMHSVRREASEVEIRQAVAHIARRHRIDRIAALDDFDVETGAMLREFFQLPGFHRSVATRFRDKLTMRTAARQLGIRVPEFVPVFNDDAVREWVSRVPAPWVLKPRSSAAATGIRKIAGADDLWRTLEATGDERPSYLLEQFITGDVCHVDSIVRKGEVVFDVASKYRQPPMQIAHEGGVFITRRLPDSLETRSLTECNRRLLAGFGLSNGVSHTEFIVGRDGVTFLETSARVGGAYIVDMIEAASGINLWREWAKIEIAGEDGAYEVPPDRRRHAGIVLSLARQENPDMSGYTDPEIVTRVRKRHHAGLIVASDDPERVETLLGRYAERFHHDFFATMPARDRPLE